MTDEVDAERGDSDDAIPRLLMAEDGTLVKGARRPALQYFFYSPPL
jgi:hypothetical protein